MPGVPFSSCSIGVATAWVTVMASAPGYEALTLTTGGTMSGYWSTGSITSPIEPIMSITIDITIENTGWSRKKLRFMTPLLCFLTNLIPPAPA